MTSASRAGDRQPDALDTGIGRVRSLLQRSNGEYYLSERLASVAQAAFIGGMAGFIIGGRFGSRIAVKAHVLNNQLTKYPSVVQAKRELHSASILGFLKSGYMWGWRSFTLAGFYSLYQTLGKEYRDKDDGLNYLLSGVATGCTYKLFAGPRQMFVAIVIGTLLSSPVALLMQSLRWAVPEQERAILDRRRRLERAGEYLEWEERQGRTDLIISELEQDISLSGTLLQSNSSSQEPKGLSE